MIKVLNLYSGLGGNRKFWGNVDVTAVEMNYSIANKYKELFPDDNVIVGDAHQYLLEHFKEFDFIWSSPPCQSHSHLKRLLLQSNRYKNGRYEYLDMKLWQEIILLKHFAPTKTKWVIENVRSYYKPLIPPSAIIGRHAFWSNFPIKSKYYKAKSPVIARMKGSDSHYGFVLRKGDVKDVRRKTVLRNLVNPEIAKYIFNEAIGYTEPVQDGLFAK